MDYTKQLNKNWEEYKFFNKGLNLAVEKGILKQEHILKTENFYDGDEFTLRVKKDPNFIEINLVGKNIEKGKDLLTKICRNKLNDK